MFPKSLQLLIEQLKKLPAVGNKTAQRYALAILNMDEMAIQELSQAIIAAKEKVGHCQKCGNYCESDLCDICLDTERNVKQLCVISYPTDIYAIEKTRQYQGLYYCLNGLISINNHILPEDLNIEKLIERIKKDNIQEVILALSSTIEGETTMYYLAKKLQGITTVTQLATGLPMGTQLEYSDDLTLVKALQYRKKM